MTLEIRVEEQPVREALEVCVETPMWKVGKVLGEHFPRINKHIESGGGERAGAPYARYVHIDWEAMRTDGFLRQMWKVFTHKQRLHIGMPVASRVEGRGDIEPVTHPAVRCVRAVHRGAYHKVDATYKKVIAWAEANGVTLADTTIENYVNDPTTVATEDIETVILIPIDS